MAYISNQHRLAELLLVSGMAFGWAVPVSAQVSPLTLERALDRARQQAAQIVAARDQEPPPLGDRRARHSKIGVEHAGVQ